MKFNFLNIILGLTFVFQGIIAQPKMNPPGYPKNDYLLIPFFHENKIKVQILAKSVNDELIFLKTDSGKFISDFSVDYLFTSLNNKSSINERNIDTLIEVNSFIATNSKVEYAKIFDHIEIKPDNYEFSIKGYTDNGRKELFSYSDSLNWNFENNIAVSNSFILKSDSTAFISQESIPFGVPGNIMLPVFWRKNFQPDSIQFLVYKDSKNKVIWKNSLAFPPQKQFLIIPGSIEKLPEGSYTLQTVFMKNKRKIKSFKHNFNIKWMDKPWSLSDYQIAEKPLKAALEDDFEALVLSKCNDEMLAFKKYWKEMDPTPNSEYNELEAEFYKRADDTQRKFGSERKYGWETDMGEIYLKFGPPEKVNDQSLNPSGNPYVVWLYPSANMTFKFVANGDEYKLEEIRSLENENEKN